MNISKLIIIAGIFVMSIVFPTEALGRQEELTCHGNIETFDKKLIQAGAIYIVVYNTSEDVSKVHFAGREFDAKAERGKSWKGIWLKRMDDKVYFSFLPDDGGAIKFQFEENRWFSGNCLQRGR